MGYTAGGMSVTTAGGAAVLAANGADGTTIWTLVAVATVAACSFMVHKARSRNRRDLKATGEL